MALSSLGLLMFLSVNTDHRSRIAFEKVLFSTRLLSKRVFHQKRTPESEKNLKPNTRSGTKGTNFLLPPQMQFSEGNWRPFFRLTRDFTIFSTTSVRCGQSSTLELLESSSFIYIGYHLKTQQEIVMLSFWKHRTLVLLFTIICANGVSSANADLLISGWSVAATDDGAGNRFREERYLTSTNGDLSLQVPNLVGTSSQVFTWSNSGNNITDIAWSYNTTTFGPTTVDWHHALGFEVWATAGTQIKIEYFPGNITTYNTQHTFFQSPGTAPWTITQTIHADPNRERIFEGRQYFRNTPIAVHATNGSSGFDPRLGRSHAGGSFQFRVTNLSAVPEPSSMVLVGLVGLTALGARRRFRFTRSGTSDSCSTPIEQASK